MRKLFGNRIIFMTILVFTACSEQAYKLLPVNTATFAVDPRCSQDGPLETQSLAKWSPLPLTVADNCLVGFEINDRQDPALDKSNPLVLRSINPLGSQARTLELDYATYVAPNSVEITGVTLDGSTYSLFNSCVLQTWLLGSPSGLLRPCEDATRDFRLKLRAGTTRIEFKPEANTPYYVRILGLCDFDLSAIPRSAPRNLQTLRFSDNRNPSPLENTLYSSGPRAGQEVCPASARVVEGPLDLN